MRDVLHPNNRVACVREKFCTQPKASFAPHSLTSSASSSFSPPVPFSVLCSAPYTSRQPIRDSQIEKYSASTNRTVCRCRIFHIQPIASFAPEEHFAISQSQRLRIRNIPSPAKCNVCASFSYLLRLLFLLFCSLLLLVLRTLHRSTTNRRLSIRGIEYSASNQSCRLRLRNIPHTTIRVACVGGIFRTQPIASFTPPSLTCFLASPFFLFARLSLPRYIHTVHVVSENWTQVK